MTDVLQEGRLYVLDTGQKVHYERMKKHVPAPWEWAAHQPFRPNENIAIIADPYVEENQEEITSDISQESYLPEQLDPASPGVPEPSAPPPRRIQTRTQTALQEGRPRRRFSHYGYSSESEPDEEREVDVEMPTPQNGGRNTQGELEEYFFSDNPLEPLFPEEEAFPPVGTHAEEGIPTESSVPGTLPPVHVPPDSLA